MATCQICGRRIKLVRDVIAHHGYRRPGAGWQTASCYGARGLPYEVSRDLIPTLIKRLKESNVATRAALAKHLANPPATLLGTEPRKPSVYTWTPKMVEHTRPEGFDPNAAYLGVSDPYARAFRKLIGNWRSEISIAENWIDDLQARFDNWVPPIEGSKP